MDRLEGFYAVLDDINELGQNASFGFEAELVIILRHLTQSIMVLADKNEMTGEDEYDTNIKD